MSASREPRSRATKETAIQDLAAACHGSTPLRHPSTDGTPRRLEVSSSIRRPLARPAAEDHMTECIRDGRQVIVVRNPLPSSRTPPREAQRTTPTARRRDADRRASDVSGLDRRLPALRPLPPRAVVWPRPARRVRRPAVVVLPHRRRCRPSIEKRGVRTPQGSPNQELSIRSSMNSAVDSLPFDLSVGEPHSVGKCLECGRCGEESSNRICG